MRLPGFKKVPISNEGKDVYQLLYFLVPEVYVVLMMRIHLGGFPTVERETQVTKSFSL